MRDLPWRSIFAWLLAGFFVVGGLTNLFAPASIREDFARWGFPGWFHYLTAACELSSAALIAFRPTRIAGTALASAIMVSAATTLILHGEYLHALAPLTVFICTVLVGLATMRTGRQE
jgi:hypothetical protein